MTFSPFVIEITSAAELTVEAGQERQFSFAIHAPPARGKIHEVALYALLVDEEGEGQEADWLLVSPSRDLSIRAGSTETVTITVRPTTDSPQGRHTIALAIVDKERSENAYEDSPFVTCEIVAPSAPIEAIPTEVVQDEDVAIENALAAFESSPAESSQVAGSSAEIARSASPPAHGSARIGDVPAWSPQDAESVPTEIERDEGFANETAQDMGESSLAESSQTSGAPAERSPTESTQAEDSPADSPGAEDTPADSPEAVDTPAESPRVEDSPAESPRAVDTPAESPRVEDSPAESPRAVDTPADSAPAKETPTQAARSEDHPTGRKPPIAPARWKIPVLIGSLLFLGGAALLVWKLTGEPDPGGEPGRDPAGLGGLCDGNAAHPCKEGFVCVGVAGIQKCLLAGGARCTPGKADECASGECKESTLTCAIPLGAPCDPADKPTLCARSSSCDPRTRTCLETDPICKAGLQECTMDRVGIRICDDQGQWKVESCPPKTPRCRDGRCQCVENEGQQCNCGGTVQCDGTCSKPASPDVGKPCGRCGGTIQCDGSCSEAALASVGKPCGQCGGIMQCNGTCSKVGPPDVGKPCGQCGGTVRCDGTCSKPDSPDVGKPCGQCGGTLQCDGTCSKPTPANLGKKCNICGGQMTCTGCSKLPQPCPPGYTQSGPVCRKGTDVFMRCP